jgi:hypothetical protein
MADVKETKTKTTSIVSNLRREQCDGRRARDFHREFGRIAVTIVATKRFQRQQKQRQKSSAFVHYVAECASECGVVRHLRRRIRRGQ